MPLPRRDVWTQRMARYRASSLTVKEFCRRERVSVPSFYQWKKKLAEASFRPSFVPVSLPTASPAPVVVKLPGDAEVRIDPAAQAVAFSKCPARHHRRDVPDARPMTSIAATSRIIVFTEPTDMRKSFNGLSGIVAVPDETEPEHQVDILGYPWSGID